MEIKTATSFTLTRVGKVFFILFTLLIATGLQAQPVCNAHFSHYSNPHNSDSVHFYPATNGTTAHYYWTFGDGSSSHNQDPWHLYASAGKYYVCLTVTDTTSGGTCSDTWCDSVHVTAPVAPTCNAQFQHYSNPHNSDSVHFYPATNGSTAHYYWTFGDGSSSNNQYPWHLYASAGKYYVCLTVTDTTSGGTCSDSWCDSVHVIAPAAPTCNAQFQHYSNPHNSDSVHFYPSTNTNGSTAHYYWTFGDGSSSNNHDPWHLYASAGKYYVCLTVTDTTSGGICSDTWCDSVHVTAPAAPTCNAHFQHYSNPHNSDSVHFYPATNGSTAHYYWMFGDGSSSNNHDPWHLYASAGKYYVCLTVTDTTSGGTCSDTWCDSVHVATPTPPVCNAHFAHYSIHDPDSVHFYPASNGSTAHYSWTFGDGGSSTLFAPWHYYANPGTYYACLTVTDTTSGGTCSDTWCDSVHVTTPTPPTCNAHFSHYSKSSNQDSVHFYIYPNTNGSTAHYYWTFGDGGSSSNHDPWHYYASAGMYYVCLTVTDTTSAATCTDSWCDSVHVTGPTAPVSIYPNPVSDVISVIVHNNSNPITFKIYDNKGRLVYHREDINDSGLNLTTDGMSTGYYFYQAYEGERLITTGKLIVIKK